MHVSYLGSSESAAFIADNSVRIPFYSQTTQFSPDVENLEARNSNLCSLSKKKEFNSTFFVRAQGDFTGGQNGNVEKSDILSGDVLVVNRSLIAQHGDVVIAREEGKMSIVTLQLNPDVLLRPKNKAYSLTSETRVSQEMPNVEVFGVVTDVVRQLK